MAAQLQKGLQGAAWSSDCFEGDDGGGLGPGGTTTHLVLEDEVLLQPSERVTEGKEGVLAERLPLVLSHHHTTSQLGVRGQGSHTHAQLSSHVTSDRTQSAHTQV